MAEHGPTGPPWKRLTMEQLNGAQFALRYLRTSVTIKGEALANLDMLLLEIDEERKHSTVVSSDDCPRNSCRPTCTIWKSCHAKDIGHCPYPSMCMCQPICEYRKKGDL
jgi:hypothetical protein